MSNFTKLLLEFADTNNVSREFLSAVVSYIIGAKVMPEPMVDNKEYYYLLEIRGGLVWNKELSAFVPISAMFKESQAQQKKLFWFEDDEVKIRDKVQELRTLGCIVGIYNRYQKPKESK